MFERRPPVSTLGIITHWGFGLLTTALVIIWCLKIGWLSGVGYWLIFSFAKRCTVLGVSRIAKVEEEEDLPKFERKILIGLVCVHLVQIALLVVMLR
jgi:hypothetical protein